MTSPENSPLKIVWFSEIKWNYLKTRKQNIIELFPENWEILFIEPYVRGAQNDLYPVKTRNITRITIPFIKATPFKLINIIFSNEYFFKILSYFLFLRIKNTLKRLHFNSPDTIIALSNVLYIEVIKKIKNKSFVIYDCNDYPAGFTNALKITEKCLLDALKHSNTIITVSKKLVHDLNELYPNKYWLIGNGVNYDLFAKPKSADQQLPKTSKKPIIFFSGAIANWLNYDLIRKCILSYSSCSFIFVGPIKDDISKQEIRLFSQLQNFSWIPPVPHEQLPQLMSQADVCILPFKINRRTSGANPNTLYEYLACGKPVVSLNYSDEINELSELIHVARNDDEFVSFIGRALQEQVNKERLQSIAEQNSWKSKSQQFVDLINRSLAEKHR